MLANPIINGVPPRGPGASPTEWLYQYGALPGTPLRAVAYIERGINEGATAEETVVVGASTDTGKTFPHFVRYKASDFGLPRDAHLVMRSSQCLWRDQDGSVSLDVFVSPATGDRGRVVYAKVPLGIQVKGGRALSR